MAKSTTKAADGRKQAARKASQSELVTPTPLNFKVPADFRRDFKTYAAQHNKKLNQLLYEAFDALKAKHAN